MKKSVFFINRCKNNEQNFTKITIRHVRFINPVVSFVFVSSTCESRCIVQFLSFLIFSIPRMTHLKIPIPTSHKHLNHLLVFSFFFCTKHEVCTYYMSYVDRFDREREKRNQIRARLGGYRWLLVPERDFSRSLKIPSESKGNTYACVESVHVSTSMVILRRARSSRFRDRSESKRRKMIDNNNTTTVEKKIGIINEPVIKKCKYSKDPGALMACGTNTRPNEQQHRNTETSLNM